MKKVLVVDDTKNIRLLLTKCLELEGYEVSTAKDGQEALEQFKSRRFDLAFLDIKMPQLSGTEVLKKIRDQGITTPVIIITAYATIKNAVDCTQMGAVAYLQKPFTADKVRTVLNDIILPSSEAANDDMKDMTRQIKKHLEDRQFAKAMDIIKKAVSEEPANADLYLLLSSVYQGMGDARLADRFHNIYEVLKG